MTFPLSYQRKFFLPTETPENYSNKLIEFLCQALNREKKCEIKCHKDKIWFNITSWNIMSWRAFNFINSGTLQIKNKDMEVELHITLNFSQSALVVFLLSIVFALLVNGAGGSINVKEAIVTLICSYTLLFLSNRLTSIMYFNSLLKVVFQKIS